MIEELTGNLRQINLASFIHDTVRSELSGNHHQSLPPGFDICQIPLATGHGRLTMSSQEACDE